MSGTTSGTAGTFPPDTGITGTGTREAQLTRLYDTVFDRAPDSGGLAFWTAFLNQGRTLDTVADLFVRSPEFQGRGTLGNPDFVGLMYRNGLEREADAPGLGFWTSGLQGNAIDRGGVALAISESNEGVASSLARGTGAAGTGTATQTSDGSTGTGTGTGTAPQTSDGSTGTGTATQTSDGSAGTATQTSDGSTGTGTQTADGSSGTGAGTTSTGTDTDGTDGTGSDTTAAGTQTADGSTGAGTAAGAQTADGSTGTGAGTTSAGTGSADTGSTGSGTTGAGTQTADASAGAAGTGAGAQTASVGDTGAGLGDDTSSDSVRILTPEGELFTVRVVGEDLPVGSEVVDTAAAGDAPDGVIFLDDAEEAALVSSPGWFLS
jgi:hypothetical protein